MAQSPSHTWGQIVGTVIERGVVPILRNIAQQYNLYLDSQGYRQARRGRKVTWKDTFGNAHDLDYVFERNGSHIEQGTPAGFVEVAWRRYTKHSKNKAQEIQGAIRPLVETYHEHGPFMAAIIAGDFTSPALTQLRSLGFRLLYFPYEDVVAAFENVAIDASYDEETEDQEFINKITAWNSLSTLEQQTVVEELIHLRQVEVERFKESLADALGRTIDQVIVLPLYGSRHVFVNASEALEYLSTELVVADRGRDFIRLEVEVRYSNGDRVTGSYLRYDDAFEFLRRVCDLG